MNACLTLKLCKNFLNVISKGTIASDMLGHIGGSHVAHDTYTLYLHEVIFMNVAYMYSELGKCIVSVTPFELA